MTKPILLTGAAGMLGTWLRPHLVARYGKLRSSDIAPVGPALQNEEIVHCDLADRKAVDALRASPCMWYAIAPEGTRRQVEQWKPGFWRIAHGAGVPVIVAAFDYPSRTITIGPAFALTGDIQADIAQIQRWYAPFRGRNHDVLQPAEHAPSQRVEN